MNNDSAHSADQRGYMTCSTAQACFWTYQFNEVEVTLLLVQKFLFIPISYSKVHSTIRCSVCDRLNDETFSPGPPCMHPTSGFGTGTHKIARKGAPSGERAGRLLFRTAGKQPPSKPLCGLKWIDRRRLIPIRIPASLIPYSGPFSYRVQRPFQPRNKRVEANVHLSEHLEFRSNCCPKINRSIFV